MDDDGLIICPRCNNIQTYITLCEDLFDCSCGNISCNDKDDCANYKKKDYKVECIDCQGTGKVPWIDSLFK